MTHVILAELYGTKSEDRDNFCKSQPKPIGRALQQMFEHLGQTYGCTRDRGHEGLHVAHTQVPIEYGVPGMYEVVAVWDEENALADI